MILSDRDIMQSITAGELTIEHVEDFRAQLQPASFDVRLSAELMRFAPSVGVEIDTRAGLSVGAMKRSVVDPVEGFILDPGEFLLASTVERVSLPNNLVAAVNGRSSLGRLGVVVHATAGYIDPGFSGHVTLELFNMGPRPVRLYAGQRVAQLVFYLTITPCERPYGPDRGSKYHGEHSRGVVASKVHRDDR
jgi:dCTP deaminase